MQDNAAIALMGINWSMLTVYPPPILPTAHSPTTMDVSNAQTDST